MNETTFTYLTITISIVAVVVSIVSTIYARRAHLFEIKKQEQEIRERISKERPQIFVQDAKFIFLVRRAEDLYKFELKNAMREKLGLNAMIEQLGLEKHRYVTSERNEAVTSAPLKSGVVMSAEHSVWKSSPKNIWQVTSGFNGTAVHLTSIKAVAEIIIFSESDVPNWIDNFRIGLRFRPPTQRVWLKMRRKWNGFVEWFVLAEKDKQSGVSVVTTFLDRLFDFPYPSNVPNTAKLVELSITDFITSEEVSLMEPIRIEPNSKLRWLVTLEFTPEGVQSFFSENYYPHEVLVKTEWENQDLSDSKSLFFEYQLVSTGTAGESKISKVPRVDWNVDVQSRVAKDIADNIDTIMETIRKTRHE